MFQTSKPARKCATALLAHASVRDKPNLRVRKRPSGPRPSVVVGDRDWGWRRALAAVGKTAYPEAWMNSRGLDLWLPTALPQKWKGMSFSLVNVALGADVDDTVASAIASAVAAKTASERAAAARRAMKRAKTTFRRALIADAKKVLQRLDRFCLIDDLRCMDAIRAVIGLARPPLPLITLAMDDGLDNRVLRASEGDKAAERAVLVRKLVTMNRGVPSLIRFFQSTTSDPRSG